MDKKLLGDTMEMGVSGAVIATNDKGHNFTVDSNNKCLNILDHTNIQVEYAVLDFLGHLQWPLTHAQGRIRITDSSCSCIIYMVTGLCRWYQFRYVIEIVFWMKKDLYLFTAILHRNSYIPVHNLFFCSCLWFYPLPWSWKCGLMVQWNLDYLNFDYLNTLPRSMHKCICINK